MARKERAADAAAQEPGLDVDVHDRDLGSTGHGTGAAGRDLGRRDPVFVDRREHEAPRRLRADGWGTGRRVQSALK